MMTITIPAVIIVIMIATVLAEAAVVVEAVIEANVVAASDVTIVIANKMAGITSTIVIMIMCRKFVNKVVSREVNIVRKQNTVLGIV